MFTDLDGTFAAQPFCKGCTVLTNQLVRDPRAHPECYQDRRYGWGVCKPDIHFISATFDGEKQIARFGMRRNASKGMYLDQENPDMDFYRHKVELGKPRFDHGPVIFSAIQC